MARHGGHRSARWNLIVEREKERWVAMGRAGYGSDYHYFFVSCIWVGLDRYVVVWRAGWLVD